ncbi:MAG TPA: DUF2961 domain-containing protein [Anaerohalosphaeraceae bacterium]|nr:DUF2961 domain-containing protein [Anaerohalosphaeraceae bacterium]
MSKWEFWVIGSLVIAVVLFVSHRLFAAAQPAGAAQPDNQPDNVDLRPAFQKMELAPRVQGNRNTCSVFTVAGAIEYALAKKQGKPTRLSVEYLNWAANDHLAQKTDGGYFSDIWKGFIDHGACPEQDMPYQDKYNPELAPDKKLRTLAAQAHTADLRLHWIKEWNPNTGLTDTHLAQIKQVLGRQWPVCGGFRWPKKPVWTDDVLNTPPADGVIDGHSVLLVGYRDDPRQPGGGMFIFRNSNNGGRDGWMTYEYACTYMNDAVWIDYPTDESRPRFAPTVNEILGPQSLFPKGRNRRVSSNEQPGWHTENLDMDWLMPGQSVNMPILEGPGVITHIWFTSHSGWVGELNSLSLRIYYDDDTAPGVEVPVGDFFAVGHGKPAVVNSIPVQVSPTGSLTCYWRMPFRKNARIVVTNDNPDRSTGLYWQVDWMQFDELPAETPYFYARYRQEYPAVMGQDYLLADIEGCGYYVGTVLSVTLAQESWFGEGDDYFYIDGEQVPSLQGTGTEDYFNDAWGYRVRTSPWFGQPAWQGDTAGDSGVCYRWHLPDPVYFTQSLKVAIEHKGNLEVAEDGFFLERPDFFSSVAFWYQTGKPKTTFPPLPAWNERRVPWQQHHLVKTYRFAKSTGKAAVGVEAQGFFGARPVLTWPNTEPGAMLTLPFELSQAGRFAVRLTAASGPVNGTYDILIDDKKVKTADFRAAESGELDLVLGTHTLDKGKHTIAFRAADSTEKAGPLAVEILRLLALPPEAKRAEKTHNEAHYVRLGIGRAIYAYRLAFDEVPESLDILVEKGFMPARYLKDENNLPLKSWKEGDALTVESPGKDHWKKSWTGLDPRR